MWVINPQCCSDAVITVTANIDGKSQEVGSTTFRVRPVPPPLAFLIVNKDGNKVRFRGGPLTKDALVEIFKTGELMAAIDDGILDIPFLVLGFETTRFDDDGFAIRETSTGAKFTDKQLSMIKEMDKGKTLLIRAISVKGPDGVTQMLKHPMEVIIME
ncbi:hypothetical protein AGMMS49982_23410 [Bacteroidia bacterium]|nr:hypothetical protein AGMMS49982_23410 [Bacteroidia bacterium]